MDKLADSSKRQKGVAPIGTPPAVKAPPRVMPVVVTLVFDPASGQIAVTSVFQVDAQLLIHVLQKAAEQVISFAAIEHVRRQSAEGVPHTGE